MALVDTLPAGTDAYTPIVNLIFEKIGMAKHIQNTTLRIYLFKNDLNAVLSVLKPLSG